MSAALRSEGIQPAKLFRFSLGPVSSFIGEARRTRDYWAGSFLLSWLSATAIRAAHENGADILSPFALAADQSVDDAPDPFFRAAVLGEAHAVEYDATLPNQFRALVPDTFDPAVCRAAVVHKWMALANAVWAHFVKDAVAEMDGAQRTMTEEIWSEQIGTEAHCFWETVWVSGEAEDPGLRPDDLWLADRKRWRAPFFLGDTGPGDLCALMPLFREISGRRRSKEGQLQTAFWNNLRSHVEAQGGRGEIERTSLDLRPGERLSAPALVKRLFPRLPVERLRQNDLFGWTPPSTTIWQSRLFDGKPDVPINVKFWPSTAAVAAHHWVQSKARTHDLHLVREYNKALADLDDQTGRQIYKLRVAERQSRLHAHLVYGTNEEPIIPDPAVKELCQTDGKLFYLNEWENSDSFQEIGVDPTSTAFHAARRALSKLCNSEAPSPYYAILQVDGDQLGKSFGRFPEHSEAIATALKTFVTDCRSIFSGSSTMGRPKAAGDVIYSSADELIAVTPVEDALSAAILIRKAFSQAFEQLHHINPASAPTLSCSIVFARYSTALGWVIRRSGEALELAKNQNGRDSIRIEVMHSSGTGPVWMTTWDTWTIERETSVETLLRCHSFTVGENAKPKRRLLCENNYVHRVVSLVGQGIRSSPSTGHYRGYPGGNLALCRQARGVAASISPDPDARKQFLTAFDDDDFKRILVCRRNDPTNTQTVTTSAFRILAFLEQQWRKA